MCDAVYDAVVGVTAEACRAIKDKKQLNVFPADWLFHSRWGIGPNGEGKLPSGAVRIQPPSPGSHARATPVLAVAYAYWNQDPQRSFPEAQLGPTESAVVPCRHVLLSTVLALSDLWGEVIRTCTVGGRTTAIVPSVQSAPLAAPDLRLGSTGSKGGLGSFWKHPQNIVSSTMQYSFGALHAHQ